MSTRIAGDDAHAKTLLEPLLDAIEAEDRAEQIGVDLWHYTQLANIYMREGNDAAANAVLERYCTARPFRRATGAAQSLAANSGCSSAQVVSNARSAKTSAPASLALQDTYLKGFSAT